uniref:Putative secreted protein n=1 Tax=Ixodes ricinus TaxID=34613 RepID=A0A147BKT4_IXORI
MNLTRRLVILHPWLLFVSSWTKAGEHRRLTAPVDVSHAATASMQQQWWGMSTKRTLQQRRLSQTFGRGHQRSSWALTAKVFRFPRCMHLIYQMANCGDSRYQLQSLTRTDLCA